jgi:hypothetical protein
MNGRVVFSDVVRGDLRLPRYNCYNVGQKVPSPRLLSGMYDSIQRTVIVGLYYIVV